jgi:hypothetical protein
VLLENRTLRYIFGSNREEVPILVAARGLRPLVCWDCGFEYRQGHGCLCLLNVVCCEARGIFEGLITHTEESYGVSCF